MSRRTQRVAEEVKYRIIEVFSKELTEITPGGELGLVTVTRVIMSNDLKNAKIYLSFLGNKLSTKDCIEKITYRKKLIRMYLGSKLHLKYIPDLSFYYDATAEYANRINALIKEIHRYDKQD